jgi:hypothetical protein
MGRHRQGQRQWPVPHTATAPAPAPTTNHRALRRRRCQNVPPLAVATAASRSRVRAVNFVALSAAFRFAAASWAWRERQSCTKSNKGFRSAAGICAEGASGRSCWFVGAASEGDSSVGELSPGDAGSRFCERSSLLCCGRRALRRIERDGLRERKKFWQIANNLRGPLCLPLQRFDLRERVFERNGSIAFTCVGSIECLLLGCDRSLQAQAIVMLREPSVESHGGEKHGEQNSGDFECVSREGQ